MSKIMIVDDSQMVRKALRFFLEAANHEIVCDAKDGIEAVEGYEKFKPDIVTMDIDMPRMDGLVAIKKIIHLDPKAKIIMMSALNKKELVMEAISSGAKKFLLKPVTKENAVKLVEEVLKD